MSRKRKLCNLTSYCRICLVRDASMTDILSDNVKLSLTHLEKCTSVQIINKPDFPQNVCHVCLYKMEMWNELITIFLKTNDKLNLNKENKKQKLDNENIDSIEAELNLIKSPVKDLKKLRNIEVLKNVVNEKQIVCQPVTNNRSKRLSSNKEALTKRWEERKKALIADCTETQSDSDNGDNNFKLSPIQKARVATKLDKDALKQRRVKNALKNLESNLADKYYIARSKIQINDEEESKKSFRRVRSDTNILPNTSITNNNDKKDNIAKINKLNSENCVNANENDIFSNVTRKTGLRKINSPKSNLVEVVTENSNYDIAKNKNLENRSKLFTNNNIKNKARKQIKSKTNNAAQREMLIKRLSLTEDNLSELTNEDNFFSCSDVDQQKENGFEKKKSKNKTLNISETKSKINIPQSQKSSLLTENGGTAQLVKSEIQLGNSNFIITSAVQLPKSLSVATNNSMDNDQLNKTNEIQLNTLDISHVILQDHPNDIIQNCLKIEVEGMEYNILQRVQHELANYIDKIIPKNYLENGEITALNKSITNGQPKDSYSALNDQLKIIIGKILKKNSTPDLSISEKFHKYKTVSSAFAKAAEKSKIFQPTIFIPRMNFEDSEDNLNIDETLEFKLNDSKTSVQQKIEYVSPHKSTFKFNEDVENNCITSPLRNGTSSLNKQNKKELEDNLMISDDYLDQSDSDFVESNDDVKIHKSEIFSTNKFNNNFHDNDLSISKKLESNKNTEEPEIFMIDSDADTVINEENLTNTNLKNKITAALVSNPLAKSAAIRSRLKKISPSKQKEENIPQKLNQDNFARNKLTTPKLENDSKPISHATENTISYEPKNRRDDSRNLNNSNRSRLIPRSKSTTPMSSNNTLPEQTDIAPKGLKKSRSITPLIPSSIAPKRPRSTTPKHVTFNDPLVVSPKTSRSNTPKIPKSILDSSSVNIVIPKAEKSITKKSYEKEKSEKKISNTGLRPLSRTENAIKVDGKKSSTDEINLADNEISCERHICGICGEELKSKEDADTHIKKHNTNKATKSKPTDTKTKARLMRCKRCQAVVEAKCVKQHVCFSATYPCTVCRLNFGNEKLLADHSLLHKKNPKIRKNSEKSQDSIDMLTNNIDNYSCFLCDKVIQGEEKMKEHLQFHSNSENEQNVDNNNYQCAVCGEVFDTEESLEVHIGHHIEDNDSELNENKFYDTNQGEYKCTECTESFETSLLLAMHLTTHEEEEIEESEKFDHKDFNEEIESSDGFVCNICDEMFDTNEELIDHKSDEHNSNPELHLCMLCEKKFESHVELREHVSSHFKNKN